MKQITIATALILAGTLSRTIFHIGPNFELVTASAVLAGAFIKNKKIALIVPLATMAITDTLIGNTNIFMFTWSAYLLMPFIGSALNKLKGKNVFSKALAVEGLGLASLLVFFLWTNFGVVVTTNMYDKSLTGLITSYINALPFLKPQLFSTVVFLPAMFLVGSLLNRLSFRFNTNTNIDSKSLVSANAKLI